MKFVEQKKAILHLLKKETLSVINQTGNILHEMKSCIAQKC